VLMQLAKLRTASPDPAATAAAGAEGRDQEPASTPACSGEGGSGGGGDGSSSSSSTASTGCGASPRGSASVAQKACQPGSAPGQRQVGSHSRAAPCPADPSEGRLLARLRELRHARLLRLAYMLQVRAA